jgi:hypothetical protein
MNSPWHQAHRCAGQDIAPTAAEYIDELVGRVLVGDPFPQGKRCLDE